ncbi:uncharacterized protein LOC100845587 [Brachypodium distachyon]|uniref:Uncharacterized protein n=1 Tax=Brachypodium distachyon TaxID=15368 RepID=I1HUL7_BRADI|nr:uncharacterized protein LOC100845587 [Brachypodium distachyon]KQK11223.1 hypothetical protein BRADI_2g58850v3 [Brachypodium distachyon]|eukprot:XP_003567404.1 uncharacterized protein LOC100845587 [Brachypodium distachyon]
MAGARNSNNGSELRVTLLGLALLGLLLLSYSAAPVEAADGYAGARKKSFSMNYAGGRSLNSFSMNSADSERKGGSRGSGAAGGI